MTRRCIRQRSRAPTLPLLLLVLFATIAFHLSTPASAAGGTQTLSGAQAQKPS